MWKYVSNDIQTVRICRQINKFDTYDSANSDEDVKYEPQIWVCKSDYHNIWLGEIIYNKKLKSREES